MRTQVIIVKASVAGSSNGDGYTNKITLPAPDFAVPTEREIEETLRGLIRDSASAVAFRSARSGQP